MWRSPIFWRLFGTYSVLVTLALSLLGWLCLTRMESRLREDLQGALARDTLLIREMVSAPGLTEDQLASLTRSLAGKVRAQITLIRKDGTVIADSADAAKPPANQAERPEIREAAAQGEGLAQRYSETLSETMLYYALRVSEGPVGYVRLAMPLEAIDSELRWMARLVWTGGIVTLLLALVASLLLARRVTRPLVELAQAARSIARHPAGQTVPVLSRDEIGTLAQAFNEMSQACASSLAEVDHEHQQLRAVFRSMVEGVVVIDAEQRIEFLNEAASRLLNLPLDSSPGRKLWLVLRSRQLTEAVETILASDKPYLGELEWGSPEQRVLAVHGRRLPGAQQRGAVLVFHDITSLRRLEHIRQDFVANVSHELKTPLAAIQATVETLLDGAIDDPGHNVNFLRRIQENSERLNRLVLDLLSLGRIESGEEKLELEPLPLNVKIEECLSRHEHRVQAKHLTLRQNPPAETLFLMADEEALAQILDNLVDNAIKYTPAGGTISLDWRSEDGQVILDVRDTGVGIPEKDLGRIFERFYRVDKARSRELGGTGLGLSIVKHLVQTLGGSITAASQLGIGSTFTLRFPRAAPDQVPH